MTAYANRESYPANVIHSLPTSSQDAGHEPNDSSHVDGELRGDSELKTAVSVATAQLGQDLRLVGSQLLSIESGHRALMERLQRIAAQVDERTVRQLEALQREEEGARQQILTVREELEALRGSFPEQLKTIRNQCESFGRQHQIAEQRFEEIEQELRNAEDRIQKTATDQHNALEQRLRTAEPKILAAEHRIQGVEDQHGIVEQSLQDAAQKTVQVEQNWRRTDERQQATEQRSKDTDEHLQATVQRLQDLQQQLTDAVSQIKIFEPQIKSCEDRLQRNTGLLVETKKTFDEQASRRENVEISIGALAQQIEQLKAELSKVGVKSLHAMVRSNQRMQTVAMVAWLMSLLLVGYMGIGNRGSSILTQYLSQWVPGLFI